MIEKPLAEELMESAAFTLATPFTQDASEVYYEKLRENVQQLRDSGASLFIPCGNTGEYYSLTREERINIIEATVDAAGTEATVVAGAGGSLQTVVKLLREYEEKGVDGALLMHPSHTYIHKQGLTEYYKSIASETDLPLMLYKRSHEVADEIFEELSTIENVVAIKYAVNDIKSFSKLAEEVSDEVVLFNGIAERYAPSFALEGAHSFTTGIGNFVPEAVLLLRDALADEDWETARELRSLLREYEDLREESGQNNTLSAANNVPSVKYGMELAGLYGGPVRPPITSLSDEDRTRAKSLYQKISGSQLGEM